MTASRSLSATGSDCSRNTSWYGQDHVQDTSTHTYPHSPPVQSSVPTDLMLLNNPFYHTNFPPSSETSASKGDLQQYAPTTPPQALANSVHPNNYHIPNYLFHEPAVNQPQHAFNLSTNGTIPLETYNPAPYLPRYFPPTLDNSTCLGLDPLNPYPSSAVRSNLQDPPRDLLPNTTMTHYGENFTTDYFSSVEFSGGNPPPSINNDNSKQQQRRQQRRLLLTEPKISSGFQELSGGVETGSDDDDDDQSTLLYRMV